MSYTAPSKDYRGLVMIQNITSGSGQVVIPAAMVSTNNPVNDAYPALINGSVYIANAVLGKKTPSVVISAPVKASWFTAAFINALLFSIDSYYDTDVFSVGIYDGALTRVFDGCKCVGITLSQNAVGGPILCEIAFQAMYCSDDGGSLPITPTSFTLGSTDPGYLTPVSQVDFGSTANDVIAWQ